MRLLVFIVIFVSFLFAGIIAGAQVIGLYGESVPSGPFIEDSDGFIDIYVILVQSYTAGLSGVSFAAPPPDCLTGVTLIGSDIYYPAIGTIESGIEFALGSCYTTTITLMKVTFWSTGQVDSCCPYDVLPHPSSASGEVEGVDCALNTVTIGGGRIIWTPQGTPWGECGRPTVPANPSPPDGAIEQPLVVTLDWESEPTAGTGLGVFYANLYFGKNPDPPVFRSLIDPPSPQVVGPLEPNTTYYWKIVSVVSDYGYTTGPVWNFTTMAPVLVKKSTWGAIKELYEK